jgi:peptide/nickel transport system substrate-binding protein
MRMPSLAPFAVIAMVLVGCAAPGGSSRPSSNAIAPASQPAAPKRIVAAIMADPAVIHRALIFPGHSGQAGDLADLVSAGLTIQDSKGVRQPLLAENVPSVEAGTWRVQPDGKMETTWRIRPNARWHDGAPVTAADMVFTATVGQDRDLPEFRAGGYDFVEAVDAPDAATVTVRWKAPYIWADRMFASGSDAFAIPIPRHTLEQPYRESKETFRQLPAWSAEFIGAGPFKVREFMPGTGVQLDAFADFVLGRPKIDAIEARFITDPNTLTANLLANAVDTTLGSSLALEQSVDVRDQWRDGHIELTYSSWIVLYPQFMNPNTAVIGDVRFRRALLHAIDRQAMADTIQAGLVPVAHSYVSPNEPEYKETEAQVVRYEYDPRRAGQLLEEIGFARASDGGWQDGQGRRLSMEVRTTSSPAIHTKTFFPMIDYWTRLGIPIDPVVIPVQRLTDLEYRTTHPTFEVVRYPNGAANIWRLHSNQTPLPENKFTGHNRSRYVNAEWDGQIDRYLATIPWRERMQVFGQIVHELSDQLYNMGLFYDTKTVLVANRLTGVTADSTPWNAHLWDVQ